MGQYILSIDQGTTSTRAIIYNEKGQSCGIGQQEFPQYFPNDGWVEHDPDEIWDCTLQVCHAALDSAKINASQIAAIGITNQRETTVVWDRATGEPVYKAIVWQDRRTASFCEQLKADGLSEDVQARTGLLIDSYFSGTKINWILDNVPNARARAEAGELAFGTIDTFLLWRLTGGKSHKTDATNASRTLLYNIHEGQWDEKLLTALNVPASLLPEVMDSSADFGVADAALFGAEIPITGIAGDQQAALFGQACFQPGMVKSTYGTGCFLMFNTGEQALKSDNQLLTTIAYQLNGEVTYAIEGSIFVAGAAIKWCRDGARLIEHASETQAMAEKVNVDNGVYLVPAFTGLGAPHWDPDARGAIMGLTLDTTNADIVTAALESVSYQTVDLLKAMENDGAEWPSTLRVDGGMVVNNWVVQFLSDMANVKVDRPIVTETTALGAAYLAGLKVGVFESLEQITELWQCERRFEPSMDKGLRERLYDGWNQAVDRVRKV